jgi:Tfp pilus assembly protein PilV
MPDRLRSNRTDRLRPKMLARSGFSMLEVLVAIFTITFFLAGTFQLIAVEALFKVKAESQSQAAFWVQEDFETIKSIASGLQDTSDPVDECDLSDSTTYGYGNTLKKQLEDAKHVNYLVNPITRKLFNGIDKEFTLSRTYTVPSDKPHTLEIKYTVVDEEKKKQGKSQDTYTIVNRHNLVIIDAALQCPVN